MNTGLLIFAIYLLFGVAVTIKFWGIMYNEAEKNYQIELLQRGQKDEGKALTRKIIVAVVSPFLWPLFLLDVYHAWRMSK